MKTSFILIALLTCQSGLAAEVPHHKVDVCVYGGTASGVMAALAAEKEGAKVILIEPSRWLGGMTGGGIKNLDWGKGNTVGGSTYKILMEGLKEQKKAHGWHAIQGIGNKQYRERFKKAVEDRGITEIYDHRLGKVRVGDATIDSPTRQRPIVLNESFEENKEGQSIRSITLDYAPVDKTGCPIPEPKKRNAITVSAKVFIDCSYEGDLLGMSGVSYTWGRESRDHYDESLGGVRPNLWVHDIDLCGLPANPRLEGVSLRPLLEDPKADWKHVAISTLGQNNHAVRDERWRYIRYPDGSEELYDHQTDPNEWNNIAANPLPQGLHIKIIARLTKHLPKTNVPQQGSTEK